MPVYLLHGFKWPRPLIRIHIILQNLEDAAAEWLVAPGTTECMLDNFNVLFPDQMKYLPNLRFVEQFDPDDESTESNAPSQPFAYVADVCLEVKLGVDIDEFRGKGVTGNQWSALMELRDKIAPEERPGWFVVVCGDEERWAPPTIETLQQGAQHNGVSRAASDAESSQYSHRPSSARKDDEPRGFKKLFGGFTRRKSHASLTQRPTSSKQQHPPLPSPPKSADKAPQLPVSRTSQSQPSPSVITNDNLVAEVYGNSRAMKAAAPPTLPSPSVGAVELSVVPPTRAGDDSGGSRSISPIEEEPYSTPGTEYSSKSHYRRGSDTTVTNSRGVSPLDIRRARSQMDRLRGPSPGAERSSSPLSRQQRPSDKIHDQSAPSPQVPNNQPERQNSARKRRSLQKPQPQNSTPLSRGPPLTKIDVADKEDGEYEVITMAPRTLTPAMNRHGSQRRRSSNSPIKDQTSPDTYRPKGGRFPVNPSPTSRRGSNGKDPVFGQRLNQFDLVANNIENALNGMR